MNFSPKERFLADKTTSEFHAKLVDMADFHRALEAALLEMQATLPAVGQNPSVDLSSAAKMSGARDFISRLLNLTNKSTPPTRTDPTALQETR